MRFLIVFYYALFHIITLNYRMILFFCFKYKIRKQYPNTKLSYVKVRDLIFMHGIGGKWDFPLQKRINQLRNGDVSALTSASGHIEIYENKLLNGHGRVYALMKTGYADNYIPVIEHIKTEDK